MLKQQTLLGIFFDMIFNHVVAQWSEKACFFMSNLDLTLLYRATKNVPNVCVIISNEASST